MLYRTQLAPPHAVIWMGRNHGAHWSLHYRHTAAPLLLGMIEPLSSEVPCNFQVATFGLGSLIFQLFCGAGAFPLHPRPKGAFARKLLQIWPPPVTAAAWPPPPMTDPEVRRLGDQMWRWLTDHVESIEAGGDLTARRS